MAAYALETQQQQLVTPPAPSPTVITNQEEKVERLKARVKELQRETRRRHEEVMKPANPL